MKHLLNLFLIKQIHNKLCGGTITANCAIIATPLSLQMICDGQIKAAKEYDCGLKSSTAIDTIII